MHAYSPDTYRENAAFFSVGRKGQAQRVPSENMA
jgi:hypothetical protein